MLCMASYLGYGAMRSTDDLYAMDFKRSNFLAILKNSKKILKNIKFNLN
jgi:hypothetical protein